MRTLAQSRRSFLELLGSGVGLSLCPPTWGQSPPPRAVISIVGGVPTIVIDGKPFGPMFYTPGGRDAWERPEMAHRGFQLFFEFVHHVGWPGEQEEIFRQLDDRMQHVLADAPEAQLILRLYVCNPPHFARDYPAEVMAFNDGQTQHFTKWFDMEGVPPAERGYSSFASEVWQGNTSEALRRYVRHVRASAYGAHVAGYFVCGGGTEEWYYYENFDETKYCLDFSPAMKAAFRAYLRQKYGSDRESLRAAWKEPTIDFDTAEPPELADRWSADAGVFWDPEKKARVRDYFQVHNRVMEEAILRFARAIKEESGGTQLVGAFYGYLQNMWLVKGGQASFRELLHSQDIDFCSGPPQYQRRGPGEHASIRFLNASLKLHGKMWVEESDLRTVLTAPEDPADLLRNGRSLTLEDTLACLQRNFAHLLCEGAAGWWIQPHANDFHAPEILALFAKLQQIGARAMECERAAETDIAGVVSETALLTGPAFTFDTSFHLVMPLLLDAFRVDELCRLGAPVDYYELDDVLASATRPYKLYFMLNCFSLTESQRRAIDELRRHGATFVWMYAPGLFQPGATPELSPRHTRELLGFELEPETGLESVSMKLTERGAAYFPGFPATRVFGNLERPRWRGNPATAQAEPQFPSRLKLAERFCGPESGREVLARYEQGGRPSIVSRQTETATDIWIGSPIAPADLLRCIARKAGCHLYCDADEIVYANRSFLAIHTASAGRKEFRLRRPANVVELFADRAMAQNSATFGEEIQTHRTRLYYIGEQAW